MPFGGAKSLANCDVPPGGIGLSLVPGGHAAAFASCLAGFVMRSAAIQVVTTTAEKKEAEALAQAVLQQRLAACVQIGGPIESRYWWNNRIECASEWVVTIKTRHDLYKLLEKLLLELHSYDQPEIVATPLVEVSAGYLKWLNEQVDRPRKGAEK
jgi:periplasmic divalent cation tolerance protein